MWFPGYISMTGLHFCQKCPKIALWGGISFLQVTSEEVLCKIGEFPAPGVTLTSPIYANVPSMNHSPGQAWLLVSIAWPEFWPCLFQRMVVLVLKNGCQNEIGQDAIKADNAHLGRGSLIAMAVCDQLNIEQKATWSPSPKNMSRSLILHVLKRNSLHNWATLPSYLTASFIMWKER